MGGGQTNGVQTHAKGVVLPPCGVGEWEEYDDSIDCGIDVVIEQYDNFACAAGTGRYAGGNDGHAVGTNACTVQWGWAITGGEGGYL